MQFIKYTVYVVLYFFVCFFVYKLNQTFPLPHSTFVANDIRIKHENFPINSEDSINSNKLQTHLFALVQPKHGFINLKEHTKILHRVSRICIKYNVTTPLIRKHFLYSFKQRSLYCWIRKVASTSFTKLFSEMENRQVARNYYREVNYLAPGTLEELQSVVKDTNVFKLLIVRHPFQRLVSSYRDRIEDNTKYTAQAWIYAPRIFNITRPGLFRSNTTSGNFRHKLFTSQKRLKLVPTFREFSEWLIQDHQKEDVHWSQYHAHCAVCNISYHYILRLDDYTPKDIDYVLSQLKLNGGKMNLLKLEESRGGYTDFGMACKYFGTLTYEIVLKLYEKYRIDFEMYNYDIEKYLFCVNGDA